MAVVEEGDCTVWGWGAGLGRVVEDVEGGAVAVAEGEGGPVGGDVWGE